MSTPNRNAPCPCGSGKKYKKCCLNAAAPAQALGHGVNTTNTAPASSSLMQAVTLHQAGKLDEAEAAYRQLLDTNPNDADALHYLGLIALQRGHYQEAADRINGAIRINPLVPAFHCNLGNAYRRLGNPDSAIAAFSEAVRLDPRFQLAYSNMGNIFLGQGKLDDAAASFRKTISIRPDLAEAHYNLGNILRSQNKPDEAMACYRTAISIKPDYAEAYVDLGDTLQDQGKLDAAIENYRWAIAIKPDVAETYNNLGNALKDYGNLDAAIENYRQAIALNPDFAVAHNNLGIALQRYGKLDEAAACFKQALALNPNFAVAHNNLGRLLREQGDLEAAVGHYRKALQIKPDSPDVYSNLLFLYGYHSLLNPEDYLAEARNWERACLPEQARLAARTKTFRRAPPDGRRLRVGYVSGDFRQHAVSYFIEQLFTHHDRSRVELFAYSTSVTHDDVTARLQVLAEHWVSLLGMPDAGALERIEADNIDVLIDLSGHTRLNRLMVFAHRAAPVQAHYLGYFASTGLTEMDYFIGDAFLTPPETDSHFCEQVWRLPNIRASYEGKADAPPSGWQPAADGFVWVGSFNNLGKLTPETFALWARVLHALPQGRLLLKTGELSDTGNRQRVMDALAAHGIPAERVELQSRDATPGWREHMAYYDRLDIVLDPIGAHGGYTTSCDALWMGAPVISLEGDRMASRMTSSLLHVIGHPEWIAHSETEYVDKVIALARDVDIRKTLRPLQRERMAQSPLCAPQGIAATLEDAYAEMFGRYMRRQELAL